MPAYCALQHVRKERTKAKLELALWDVVNKPKYRTSTKTEDALDRIDIMRVLLGMTVRIAMEIEHEKRS